MSSALYVKVYTFIYKLDMIFLKTKGRGPGGICVLINLFTQNHAILKSTFFLGGVSNPNNPPYLRLCLDYRFIYTKPCYFKNSYKKMLSFQKVFKNMLTFKGLGVRLTLNRLGGGDVWRPHSSIFALAL